MGEEKEMENEEKKENLSLKQNIEENNLNFLRLGSI
jgi:hypothetical protein